MIRDRGNIKWRGLMLPEHVVKLIEWHEQDQLTKKPEFDEWELEAIQMEVELAYKRQSEAIVTVWKNGSESPYIGKITALDQRLNTISIEGPFGDDRIPATDIIKVECRD
ncbi:YolD-like family protein [Sporosarcina sp. FSL K6-1522]|uniref:YolD-like family protein n=1 Tax=Sporosarcina sp. FSL K6-1522 TaxID=2921554 RepID=UPI00315A3229